MNTTKQDNPIFCDNYKHRMWKSTRENRNKYRTRSRVNTTKPAVSVLKPGKCQGCDKRNACRLQEQGFMDICEY